MKSCFSGKLYVQGLKKVRTAGVAMMIAIVLLNMIAPIVGIINNNVPDMLNYTPEIIRDMEVAPVLFGLFLFAPLMAYLMFSFLNDRKQSDFYHALPQKRVAVYTSLLLAVLTWVIGTIVLSLAVNSILWSFASYTVTFSFAAVVRNLVYFSVTSLLLVAVMTLAVTVTGTTVSNVLMFFFLLFGGRYFISMFSVFVNELAPMWLPGDKLKLLMFDRMAIFHPFTANYHSTFFCDVPSLVYAAVMAVVVMILAGVAYHFRHSEMAGKSAPSRFWQHVYRIAVTTVVAILIPYTMLFDANFWLTVLTLIAAFVVYALYELMTSKRIKSFVKSLPLFVVPLLVAGIFTGFAYLSANTVYHAQPDAERIESITFLSAGPNGSYSERKIIGHPMHSENLKTDVAEEMKHYSLGRKYMWDIQKDNFQARISIKLKNGRILNRHILLSQKTWREVTESQEAKELYLTIPSYDTVQNVMLTGGGFVMNLGDSYSRYQDDGFKKAKAEASEKIYQAFIADFAAMTDAEKYNLINGHADDNLDEKFTGTPDFLRIGFETDLEQYYRSYDESAYRITDSLTPRTMAAVREYLDGDSFLPMLQNIKTQTLKWDEGRIIEVTTKDGSLYIPAEDFFSCITVDDHLFSKTGQIIYMQVDSDSMFLHLTDAEYNQLKTFIE